MIFDEMWRKSRKRNELERSYKKDIEKARKARDWKKAQELGAEEAHFVSEANDELSFLNSRNLIRRAIRLPIPLPDYNDKESWDDSWHGRVLTSKGQAQLLRDIRQEEAERIKHGMRHWREVLIPLITLLLGIIGTYFTMKHDTGNQRQTEQQSTRPAEQRPLH